MYTHLVHRISCKTKSVLRSLLNLTITNLSTLKDEMINLKVMVFNGSET